MKTLYISILVCCNLLLTSCADTWNFIKTKGNPRKNISLYKPNRIFPSGFDVSIDGKVYFSYQNDSSLAICNMDIENGNLKQITENGNYDFRPVISNNGKKILFKRGNLFGNNNNFYLVNSDGSNCKKLADTEPNIYLTDAAFSRNDSIIYFIGGALFNDTSFATRSHTHCQDIFSVNVDGTNFKRLTYYCFTSFLSNPIITVNNELIISISKEIETDEFYEKKPNAYFNYFKEKEKVITRKPFENNIVAEINLQSGHINEVEVKFNKDDFAFSKKFSLCPFIYKPTTAANGKSCVFKNNYVGLLNYDFNKSEIRVLVDSINDFPFNIGKYPNKKHTTLPDSLDIFNLKYFGNKKLIGAIKDKNNFRFGVLDIKSEKIEKYLTIDTNKFTPSKNRTIFNN